jgi:hypothetical protein
MMYQQINDLAARIEKLEQRLKNFVAQNTNAPPAIPDPHHLWIDPGNCPDCGTQMRFRLNYGAFTNTPDHVIVPTVCPTCHYAHSVELHIMVVIPEEK